MYDDSKTIVTALSSIVTTTYDQFVDDSATLPHITYIESSNRSRIDGDNIRHSTVQYEIKLWAKTKADIATYASQIDTVMLEHGYTRSGSRELVYEDMICKVMMFDGHAIERSTT